MCCAKFRFGLTHGKKTAKALLAASVDRGEQGSKAAVFEMLCGHGEGGCPQLAKLKKWVMCAVVKERREKDAVVPRGASGRAWTEGVSRRDVSRVQSPAGQLPRPVPVEQ